MDKKKQVYNAEVMALPPCDWYWRYPSPDPDWRNKSNQPLQIRP